MMYFYCSYVLYLILPDESALCWFPFCLVYDGYYILELKSGNARPVHGRSSILNNVGEDRAQVETCLLELPTDKA